MLLLFIIIPCTFVSSQDYVIDFFSFFFLLLFKNSSHYQIEKAMLETVFTMFYGSFTAVWRASQLKHHHFVILLIEQLLPEDISAAHYIPLFILSNGFEKQVPIHGGRGVEKNHLLNPQPTEESMFFFLKVPLDGTKHKMFYVRWIGDTRLKQTTLNMLH